MMRLHNLTAGVFLSVFLVTNIGLSYLSSVVFGGIILAAADCNDRSTIQLINYTVSNDTYVNVSAKLSSQTAILLA